MIKTTKKKQKTLDSLLEEALIQNEELPYEIPDNWVWVKLIDIVDFYSGSAFPNDHQGKIDLEIPFFKVGSLKDIDSNYYIKNTDNTISEEIRKKLKAKLVPRNTILFAKIGEAIKLNRRSLIEKPSCIDNNLMGIKANEKVLNDKYLLFWSLKEDFYKYSQASTIPSIRKSTLENICFPIAPKGEQKRIAKKIYRLFAKINEAKQLIEEVKESLEIRKTSILRSIIEEGKEDAHKKGWEFKTIGGIFQIFGGGTPSKSKESYWDGNIPWISAKDMKTIYIHETQDYITEEGLKNSSAKIATKGSVAMVVRSGILQHTLPVAYLMTDCTVNQDLKVFNSGEDLVNKYFLWYVKAYEKYLLDEYSKSGTTVNSIEFERFKTHVMPIPTREEIEKKIIKIESIITKENNIGKYDQQLLELDNLKQAILYKAYRGKLGTNDPTEENAIELLKEVLQSK
ncbi:restriction endonuclease subunit S [Schinkia azotoformans]|uniref:Restriction modification system DNA specificity domain-containing protein n=1 Tax=Schinkia azotoformans LMG 9581 TaxID=1131731 RepID=K6CX43_SCHAZ|nr:restriction endonuclease subunit S [Schinkia azotoformans]EKN64802.1 restriction modification system DNA specificity domain-containing protein [Schinkia azotoformans LMG 9581]MEC1640097.1 restriction endonuclease subunit S [Schinkia azotoformans]MEC1943535.1 restriction endonuclease subunit S [Schinkia azotoformans]MED4355060.1 restriction endonuclease subunit S [Schinkia azotoformans]